MNVRMHRWILGALAIGGLGAFLACSGSVPDAAPIDEEDAGDAGSEAEANACPPSGVSKGPWSLAMTRTGIKIRWEACRADPKGGIVLRPESGGADVEAPSTTSTTTIASTYTSLGNASPPDLPGTYTNHEVALKDLTPGTCFRYELLADRTKGGRFCTAQPDGGRVHFMAIADTNPALGQSTRRVLEQLIPLKPDFTIHAGDIQYYDSILETWAGWFPVMRPMLEQGALMAAIGNHEHEKDDEFENYTLRFFGDDTMGGRDAYYEFESGGVHFFALNSEGSIAPESPQGSWLTGRLAQASQRSGYRASIVFFHKPLITCGDTGQDDTSRTKYAPIFVQNKVPLVIQGHMHGYERFELDGITWLTSGGGGGRLGNTDENVSRAECASRKSAGAFFHAVDIVIEGKTIEGKTIDDSGALRDSFSITLP